MNKSRFTQSTIGILRCVNHQALRYKGYINFTSLKNEVLKCGHSSSSTQKILVLSRLIFQTAVLLKFVILNLTLLLENDSTK